MYHLDSIMGNPCQIYRGLRSTTHRVRMETISCSLKSIMYQSELRNAAVTKATIDVIFIK